MVLGSHTNKELNFNKIIESWGKLKPLSFGFNKYYY